MIGTDILTEDDLCPIAGHWRRGDLMDWLRSNSIPFVVAKNGWPRVHRKALERVLGVKPDDSGIEVKEIDFNFGAVK